MPDRLELSDERLVRPEDYQALRNMINAKHALMPKRLAVVARHILSNPDEVALSSVAAIATAAKVTPSTLTRFAQFFGYDGFAALQEIFRQVVRTKIANGERRDDSRSASDDTSREAQALCEAINACHRSLDALSSSIAIADIQSATSILSSANCIFVVAKGGAFPLAVLLQHSLARLKIRSTLLADLSGGNDVLGLARPDDAAVVIGCASDMAEITAAAATLSTHGVPVIALTDSTFSPLSELASVCFNLASLGHNDRLLPMGGIALNEALAICTQKLRQERSSAA